MTFNPSMDELLAPAAHSIHERERKVSPLSFVRRVGGAVEGGNPVWETPAQRKGRRYESRVGRWLAARIDARCLWNHVWLEYRFQHEQIIRRAQPDFVLTTVTRSPAANRSTTPTLEAQTTCFVFEVKHTWVDTTTQLNLYVALLAEFGLDAIPATLCRNLTPQTPKDRIVRGFDNLVPYSIMMVRV